MAVRKLTLREVAHARAVAAVVYQLPTAVFVAVATARILTGLVAWAFAALWTYLFGKREF